MSRVLIVTGGSRGIGAATAKLAAERGYAVCVNYVSGRKAAESVVAGITAPGGKAIAVAADVSKEADVLRLFDTVERELGAPSVLVNNAGVTADGARLADMDAARLERMLAVHVLGSLLCAREAARRMKSGGVIVNMSSALIRSGAPSRMVDYAAAKGAVEVFTRGLAIELADKGIRVNAVRPGIIATDIDGEGTEEARRARAAGFAPMKRAGEAIEVARAILWLASEESSYSTGAIVDVSGGV